MSDESTPIVILPGGGGIEEIESFRADLEAMTSFKILSYPGWQHHFGDGFLGDALVEHLAAQIERWVPHGPIRIVGYSIGGHLGYATALLLQRRGREIVGFCAIDPFLNSRAFTKGWQLIQELKFREFIRLSRSKFRRILLRAINGRLVGLTNKFVSSGSASIWGFDPQSRSEGNMLLWFRDAGDWIAALDRDPVPLQTPTILLRTPLFAGDDGIWRRRCPDIAIHEVPGYHLTLFQPENIGLLRHAFFTATCAW